MAKKRKNSNKLDFINRIPTQRLRLLNFAMVFAIVGIMTVIFSMAALLPGFYGSYERDFENRTNAHRAGIGRSRLQHVECLNTVAENYAKFLGDNRAWYHNPNLGADIDSHCRGYWTIAGENLARHGDVASQWQGLLASPEHKANIESSSWTRMGVGAYVNQWGELYSVNVFANCSDCSGGWSTPASLPADPVAAAPPGPPANAGPFGASSTDATGRVHIFARGTDGQPYVKAQNTANTNAWGPYYPMGGRINSDIAAVKHQDGKIQIFARGTDNALWTNHQTCPSCGFSGWFSLGGNLSSDPSTILGSDGRARIFYRGGDKKAWVLAQNAANNGNSWTPHYTLGGVLTSNIGLVKNSDGRIQLFARGTDDAGYTTHQNADGTFSAGWQGLGGKLTSDISAALAPDGRLRAFGRGTDNQPFVITQNATNNSTSWSGWSGLGGLVTSSITSSNAADGRVQLFALGTNGAVFSNAQTCTTCNFGGWSTLGGIATSDASVVRQADGKLAVFVRGTDGAAFMALQNGPNGGFTSGAYTGLGGIIAPQSALNVVAGQR